MEDIASLRVEAEVSLMSIQYITLFLYDLVPIKYPVNLFQQALQLMEI